MRRASNVLLDSIWRSCLVLTSTDALDASVIDSTRTLDYTIRIEDLTSPSIQESLKRIYRLEFLTLQDLRFLVQSRRLEQQPSISNCSPHSSLGPTFQTRLCRHAAVVDGNSEDRRTIPCSVFFPSSRTWSAKISSKLSPSKLQAQLGDSGLLGFTTPGWFSLKRVSLVIDISRFYCTNNELKVALRNLIKTQFPQLSSSNTVSFDFEVIQVP